MRWRAVAGTAVIAEAPTRADLDVTELAECLLRSGHVPAVTVQARTDDTAWFILDVYTLAPDGSLQRGITFPTRDTFLPFEPPVRLKRKRGRPRLNLTDEERAERKRASNREYQRRVQARRKDMRRVRQYGTLGPVARRKDMRRVRQYGTLGPVGPSRGSLGNVRADDLHGEPTPTPAPAGLASDQFAWILRGLYQQQWADVLDRQYHPQEEPPLDWRWSIRRPQTRPRGDYKFKYRLTSEEARRAALHRWAINPKPPPRKINA